MTLNFSNLLKQQGTTRKKKQLIFFSIGFFYFIIFYHIYTNLHSQLQMPFTYLLRRNVVRLMNTELQLAPEAVIMM